MSVAAHPSDILEIEAGRIKPHKRFRWGNVLVRRDPNKQVLDSGIVLPGGGQIVCRGTVIATAPQRLLSDGREVPSQVKPGDRVLLGQSGAFPIAVRDETGKVERLFMVREEGPLMRDEHGTISKANDCDEILCVVEGE